MVVMKKYKYKLDFVICGDLANCLVKSYHDNKFTDIHKINTLKDAVDRLGKGEFRAMQNDSAQTTINFKYNEILLIHEMLQTTIVNYRIQEFLNQIDKKI